MPAETNKTPNTTPQTKTAFSFDREKLQEHLDKVIDFQNKYVGMKNHNPFLWIKHNVTPLYNRMVGLDENGNRVPPEQTQELSDAILHLPLDCPPIVVKSPPEQVIIVPPQQKIIMSPTGGQIQTPRKL
jgi:hypothetical protein